jgi:FlaA1/EpsC-like NDP-sugar epimerase
MSFIGAFLLRFDFSIPYGYLGQIAIWLPALILARVIAFAYFGLFRGMWRYTGAHDLVALIKAATTSTALFAVIMQLGQWHGFPRSIFVTDWVVTIVLIGGLRFGVRSLGEISRNQSSAGSESGPKKRVLIVGAGDAGEMLVREIKRSLWSRYECVGFLDDNPLKHADHIHGVKVLGAISSAATVVSEHRVDEIIIAIPSASGKEMRSIVDQCAQSGAVIRTIPSVDSLIDGRVSLNQVRQVAIEDLLGRAPVELDMESISNVLRGSRVMVTGAGGSIGSEICRQVARFEPSSLLLVERAENALFLIHKELVERFPRLNVIPVIADIGDRDRMEAVFAKHRPTEVFHAAAHKHVPMMEWNPGEAIKNNVLGTRLVADLSNQFAVDRFVMISTDKAINPTSVMGVTKRVAEIYIQALSQRSKTRFVTVRFGNVLGSNGSVVPIFQEQIAKGGPVKVTHPDMRRYFMTIPEACQLVLQAGTMGRGGEIFVLDMGEPVKIVDLARDLIKLSGLRVDEDIEIQFTGMRPGEKLFEELTIKEENADKTRHPKIFIGRFKPHAWTEVQRSIEALGALPNNAAETVVRAKLTEIVPEFKPPVEPTPLEPRTRTKTGSTTGKLAAVGGR